MSTIDSYLLICASNIVYDIYQPLAKNKLNDRSLLLWTRVAMFFATIATILLCLYFSNVERLWIFITAILVCTALVPTIAAYYWPNVKRRAGQITTTVGFILVLIYYAWVDLLGAWDEEEIAYIWRGDLFGFSLTLNQDYGILYILPLVILTFLIAQLTPGGKK
jgi:Na+/proline symporter